MLTAYGSHKDATVYELLEPLQEIATQDLGAARDSLLKLQSLTISIRNHTDGRGTSRLYADWWEEAAAIDPSWVVESALGHGLREVNSPAWVMDNAIDEVWRKWHRDASPWLAACGRLAIDAPLLPSDAEHFEWLLASDIPDTQEGRSLLTAISARLDERPTSRSSSNAQQELDTAENVVARVNALLAGQGLPTLQRASPTIAPADDPDRRHVRTPSAHPPTPRIPGEGVHAIAQGLPGVYEVIQRIASNPRFDATPDKPIAGHVNAIGYRLIELAQQDRTADADQAVRDLAGALSSIDPPDILACLSDGFVRAGMKSTAALTSVLVWTRTRQRGGWRSFGSDANLEYLERAFELDGEVARATLGAELARVAESTDSIGPVGALIHAAGRGALPSVDDAKSLALECWNAAWEVVDRRAPRLSESDSPELQYAPSPVTAQSIADANRYMAGVVAAKLCKPGREAKRRGLVAVRFMLRGEMADVAPSLGSALEECSDPITQYAILFEISRMRQPESVRLLQASIARLATSPLLALKTLARELLTELPADPLEIPSTDTVTALRGNLVVVPRPKSRLAAEAVDTFVGERLESCGSLQDALQIVLINRVASALEGGPVDERLRSQLDVLTSRSRRRWPDAVLAHEEFIEGQLQTVAGTLRGGLIAAGKSVTGFEHMEASIAESLEPRVEVPVAIELVRVPRPNIDAAPAPTDREWSSPDRFGLRFSRTGIDLSSLDTEHAWVPIAFVEEREHDGERWDRSGPTSITTQGLVIGPGAERVDPVADGELDDWRKQSGTTPTLFQPKALVGMTVDSRRTHGLGAPRIILVPTARLRDALRLTPSGDVLSMLSDDGMEALRLSAWRAEYVSSGYELAYPRLIGQAMLLRRDLFDSLTTQFGERLRLRQSRILIPPERDSRP